MSGHIHSVLVSTLTSPAIRSLTTHMATPLPINHNTHYSIDHMPAGSENHSIAPLGSTKNAPPLASGRMTRPVAPSMVGLHVTGSTSVTPPNNLYTKELKTHCVASTALRVPLLMTVTSVR